MTAQVLFLIFFSEKDLHLNAIEWEQLFYNEPIDPIDTKRLTETFWRRNFFSQ